MLQTDTNWYLCTVQNLKSLDIRVRWCNWCIVVVLQKVKASAPVSNAKLNRDAPMRDFIVSDDDISLSNGDSLSSDDSDEEIEALDYASSLRMIRSVSDQENRPVIEIPEDSVEVSEKPKHAVHASHSDTALVGSNNLSKPGTVQYYFILAPVVFPFV